MVMEWESKLHDKNQEMNLLVDRYEKKVRSMSTELEEQDNGLAQFRETISELNLKCTNLTDELDSVTQQKNKFQSDKDKYMKMNERL